jgi:hypothetical protein|tara:strand:+ start:242 stop:514 length:273 start_codon:yes stop_codon:yes gene_type:complete
MNKSDESKIYTYIVLILGLLIWVFYFYYGDDFLTTRQYRTEYSNFFRDYDFVWFFDTTFVWLLLQVLFLYSWWNLRDCIASVLKKIHNRI